MKIALSTDTRTHLIDLIMEIVAQRGHEVVYFGPADAKQEVDWPNVTAQAAELVHTGQADEGIVLCWTGTGATIVATSSLAYVRPCATMPKRPRVRGCGTMPTSWP